MLLWSIALAIFLIAWGLMQIFPTNIPGWVLGVLAIVTGVLVAVQR